jgi:hypothetical protein
MLESPIAEASSLVATKKLPATINTSDEKRFDTAFNHHIH